MFGCINYISGIMAYKCPICGKEFEAMQQLGGHMRTHRKGTSTTHTSKRTSRNTSTAQAQEASTVTDEQASRMELVQASPSTQANTQGYTQDSTQADTEARMQAIVEKGSQASDSELAWLNAQLDRPVTRQELELAKQRLDREYAQMQETARQQAEMLRAPPPPPPAYYAPPRETTADKVVNSIDWNAIANNGLNLLAEIIRERRQARAGPSLAEQIGQLAISNFAATLSKEGGRIMGKRLGVEGEPEEEYVTKPVLQVMLGKMVEEIEKEQKARKELAERWEKLEREISQARERLATTSTTAPSPAEEAPKPEEAPQPEATTQEAQEATQSSEESQSQEENIATQEHKMVEELLKKQTEQNNEGQGVENE